MEEEPIRPPIEPLPLVESKMQLGDDGISRLVQMVQFHSVDQDLQLPLICIHGHSDTEEQTEVDIDFEHDMGVKTKGSNIPQTRLPPRS